MLNGFDSLGLDEPDARMMFDSIAADDDCRLMTGGSCVIRPDTGFLVDPVFDKETILYAEVDFELIVESSLAMDMDGHYARPDIFSLTVDTNPRENVRFIIKK